MTRVFRNLEIFIFVMAGHFGRLLGHPSSHSLLDGEAFDFVIVGGGTAGCAVASRLASSGQHSVLLIEAGSIPDPLTEIPALSVQVESNPSMIRSYQSLPQLNAGLARNGSFSYLRGNFLGGTSSINGMVLNRGSPNDYNNWAKLTGDTSWNYENLLKYFKKYEDYNGNYPSDQHGFTGPISVERPQYAPGLSEWLQGGVEMGYQIGEPNGPQTISFGGSDFAHRKGRRVSSYKGYIEPMLESNSAFSSPNLSRRKSNLLILTNTEVNRILLDDNRAVGVKFTTNSSRSGYATATKEIILTAGAVDSPALLMRSGIGPKSVLDAAKIPAVKYLPVGRNLQDHPSVLLAIVLGNRSLAIDEETDLNPETWKTFEKLGDGPYATYLGLSGQAFVASSVQSPFEKSVGWADTQLTMAHSNSRNGDLGFGVQVRDLKEWETAVTWVALAGRPKSRGVVTIDPRNVDGAPIIDFRFLEHPDDARVLVDGIKTLIRLCEETTSFRQVGCRIPTDVLPGCEYLPFRSKLYWSCYVRQITTFGYHTGGTCRMGKGQEDIQAVVDTKLKVVGVDRLRVADASIMPVVTNANTMAVVYAIAEKAADMILKHWE